MSETRPDAVMIERTLAAPIDLVWRMWTEPEHFAAWYGPTGARVFVATMDVRVGGTRLVCMEMATPNGPMRMWFAGEYLEVVDEERLVYTELMADEHGNPLPNSDQTSTEVHVELTALSGDATRMVMTHIGIPPGSPGETGWTMAFDKLADVIAR